MIRLTDIFAHVGITAPEWTYKTLELLAISGSGSWVDGGQRAMVSVPRNTKSPPWFVCLTLTISPLLLGLSPKSSWSARCLVTGLLPPSPASSSASFPLGLVFFHFLKRHSSSHLMAFTDAVPLPGTLLSALTALIPSDPWGSKFETPFISVNFSTSLV